MVASGDDFILFNGITHDIDNYSRLAVKACNRHFSFGAKGILICEYSHEADIKMLYFNSEGFEEDIGASGIRCFAKYVYEEGLVKKEVFTVETIAGIKNVFLEIDQNKKVVSVKVNMGRPILDARLIPVDIDRKRAIEETIEINGKTYTFSSVLVGVPHTVIFVDDISKVDINELGRKIEIHSIFPKKTNVNFVEIIDESNIIIYTWEIGVGRTLSSIAGSCAGVVIGNLLGKLTNTVQVRTETEELEIQIGADGEIYSKGTVNKICDGILYISW